MRGSASEAAAQSAPMAPSLASMRSRLEFGGAFGIAAIAIRVVSQGSATVRLLDVVLRGISAREAEDLVEPYVVQAKGA